MSLVIVYSNGLMSVERGRSYINVEPGCQVRD